MTMNDNDAIQQNQEPGEQRTGDALDEDDVQEALTEGETVRTDIVEHAVIESEVVESDIIEEDLVEEELVDQEIVGVAVAEDLDEDDRAYLDDEGDAAVVEEDAALAVDLDQVRSEIVEVIEQKTIESRVVEDEGTEVEISVEGVEEHLVTSDIMATDGDQEGFLDEFDVEHEFVEDDVVHSDLTERRTIERDVTEEQVLVADVTDVDVDAATVTHEQLLARELADDEAETIEAATAETATVVEVAPGDIGKDVVTPAGENIGIVSDADSDDEVLYVDPDPSLADRFMADLHWGDEDDTYPLVPRQIESIDSNTVVVDPTVEVTAEQ